MLSGRLALASVYLCCVCVCLLALKPQPAARICTLSIIKKVNSLLNNAASQTPMGSRLYTPTIDDYQQKCPSSTMKCFAEEIKVLTEEWKTQSVRNFRLTSKLETLSKMLNQTESGCLQCELFKEEKAEKFLQRLQSTLEAMNSQHC